LIGALVPLADGTEETYKLMKEDNWWRVVYGIPIFLEIFVFIFIFLFFKNPSIFDLINFIKENPEKKEEFDLILEKELRKIYEITSGD
jgi:ABC-type sugar transport system permease subunit